MERRVGARLRAAHLMGGVALATLPAYALAPAFAQETVRTQQASDVPPQEDEARDRVVVTGSLIRGVSPVGSNTLTIDEDIIEATGASNTNQVLATLPLISNAFNTNTVNQTDVGLTTFRPNIRNIGAAGGNSTLVLINGNNQVGAGILQTTPDSGVIPPGMLSRVEVLADGGSSLYGADAIGGIVNFITKRRQDGTRVDIDYGFTADGYEAASLNVTTGFDWDGGNAVLSAFTRTNSQLLSRDRDLPRQNLAPFGGTDRRTTACDTPNFTVGATTYAYNGSAFTPGAARCEGALDVSIVPQERQTALYGFATHSFTDTVTLEVTANYSDRVTKSFADIFDATSLTIPTTNFYYTPIPGAPGSQSATFSYGPALGPVNKSRGSLETYQITPTLIWDVGNDWEVRGTYNYGWSKTTSFTPQLNTAAQAAAVNGTTAATALNPYNIAATNAGVLAGIFNAEIYGANTQTLSDAKVVADGPLFSLPGGDVRVAVGLQRQDQESQPLNYSGVSSGRAAAVARNDKRSVDSVFAQAFIPIVGPDNALPFIQSFDVDASVRYDNYSDFGDTTNPKVGFSWGVVEGLTVRGSAGSAFNAPSLADSRDPAQLQIFPIALAQGPLFNFPTDLFRPTIILAGGTFNMRPQTADTWSLGLDWKPAQLEGFSSGLSYWHIEVGDLISVAPAGMLANPFNPAFSDFLIEEPTQAQLQAIFTAANPINPGLVNLPALYPPGPYLFLDLRRRNYGSLETGGLDFYANYIGDVSWGQVFATLNATHVLERDSVLPNPAAPVLDLTANGLSLTQIAATAGTTWDNLTASVTLNYNSGYDVVGIPTQTRVDSYTPVNIALAYNFDDAAFFKDSRITLNINNVFDDYPPFVDTGIGSANGSTLGRLFTIGLTKTF